MPLQATSGTASYDAFGGGAAVEPVYIEQVFQTYLYTGTGADQTITNGIDLSTKGGLVWVKSRSNAKNNCLVDTTRGVSRALASNTSGAQDYSSGYYVNSFNTTGFGVGAVGDVGGAAGITFGTWTFRKQPKFYTQGTYTGNGSVRTISHDLGSVPGVVLIKCTSSGGTDWMVFHRSASDGYFYLNDTAAKMTAGAATFFGNGTSVVAPDATSIYLGSGDSQINQSGLSYVYYLFAHNAGGFGLTGTDNVISCGSYTTDGSGKATVNLGYEPQWLLRKRSDAVSDWIIVDNMRGWASSNTQTLAPNNSDQEFGGGFANQITSTGFSVSDAADRAYIYIAIRRGPMKVPTSGTSVYQAVSFASSASNQTINPGITTDLCLLDFRNTSNGFEWFDRLRGITGTTGSGNPMLTSASTAAEANSTEINGAGQTTLVAGGTLGGYTQIVECFRRAPSFFDEVCYTGNGSGSGQVITHNLGVTPELIIIKSRSGAYQWHVYAQSLGQSKALFLETSGAEQANTAFTGGTINSTQFQLKVDFANVNGAGVTYVSYLFATCAGVSKCTAFTGTGTLQTINCGFTAGSRFVLIKRTDAAGDWYVWDSSRGLSSSTDPYLLLNSTAAEVTSTNWVDTTATGFQVTAASGNNVNINGASYIALAIA